MNNYTILHCHSDLSNAYTTLDSVTKYGDYIKAAKKCGMTALAISEHGSLLEWWHKKCDIEAAGMKYIHAVEAYITKTLEEKVRDNYHCLLIAKNKNGFRELNRLVSQSFNRNDNHFYYAPRILYDDLKATSDDIIICTACIGGILGGEDIMLKADYLQFLSHNRHRAFLEIQHHNTEKQKDYNDKLIRWSKEYGIPLIATTDTHCFNASHVEGRSIFQKGKNISFEDEDGWDLEFRTYEELCDAFSKQGLPSSIYLNAIENTNVVASQIEPFQIDCGSKYPKIYENSEDVFLEEIYQGLKANPYAKKRHNAELINKTIDEEVEVYKATQSIDFMLLQSYIRKWEKANGIQSGFGRGSVSGSFVAYLLGITQMDSLKFDLNFFRFQNPSRVTNCDIDTDYYAVDRDKIKYFLLHDHLGLDNIRCAEIITFNSVALKGAIRDVGRALEIPLNEVSEITKAVRLDDNGEWVIDDSFRQKYSELFRYVDIVNGTIVSIGTHPSGVLITDRNIEEEIGTCTLSTSDYPVSMLNMKELDAQMYVKLDTLGLDGVGLINETCKLVGIDRLNPDNVDLDDEAVWQSIVDDTTLIFQWESDMAQSFLKQFMSKETLDIVKTKNKNFNYLKWFSFGNGLLRPACESVRDDIAKGNFHDNGFKELNDFLANEAGIIAMQETIMQFLVHFCGYSQAESDNVRRAIAKKKGTEKLIPEIESRFIDYSSEHYDISKERCAEVIKPFINIILDASAYAFSWNHSDAYSCIGYILGYLRYYYPLEFLTSAFNVYIDKPDKILNITNYANQLGIKINNIKFRKSKASYMCDKETNSIYKGLTSIKYLNEDCGEYFWSIRDNEYPTFFDLLEDIRVNTSINSRQLDILIKLDFFSEFGNINKLLYAVELYNRFTFCKMLKKEKLTEAEINIIRGCAERESEKQFSKLDNSMIIHRLYETYDGREADIYDRAKWQVEFLGYTDIKIPKSPYCIVLHSEVNSYGTPFVTLYCFGSGNTKMLKSNRNFYRNFKLNDGDIIKISLTAAPKKIKSEDGKWINSNEYESILNAWSVLTND